MKHFTWIIAALFVAVVGLWFVSANQSNQTGHGDGTLTVAASFYPLQFALAEIAGDRATVINLSAGRDPHDYRPSAQDMLRMEQADLVALQGAEFEPWGEDVMASLMAAEVPVVVATKPLTLREAGEHHDHEHDDEHEHEHDGDDEMHHDESPAHEGEETDMSKETEHDAEHAHEDGHEHEDDHEHEAQHEHGEEAAHESTEESMHQAESAMDSHEHDHEHDEEPQHGHDHAHGQYDPHTWLDPVRFSETVAHLTEALVALDPAQAEFYEANAAELEAELASLDAEYEAALTSCRADAAIVSHDAFWYLADRYGLTTVPIAGLSTTDTPSATLMAELRTKALESGATAILTESSAVTDFAETLSRETGLAVLPLNPVAFVIPEGADYFSIMRDNLESLVIAYDCTS